MRTGDIKDREWIVQWSGGWSLLSSSYFGYEYTETIAHYLGASIPHAVLVSHNGFSTCYYAREELDAFGESLAKKVEADRTVATKWCADLKKRTDKITAVMDRVKQGNVSEGGFEEFVDALDYYVPPHAAVKRVVDYLPAGMLQELLPAFTDARLYAEKVYTESEKTMQLFAEWIAAKHGIEPQLVLCLVKEEIPALFKSGKFPPVKTLQERFENSALIFYRGKGELFSGSKVNGLESALTAKQSKDCLRGRAAFPGRAEGVARVVLDPKKPGIFNKGDVLVTGMTRPEYLPLIVKASAVVTDGGGVLSHAAITSRELKKPCVIGTVNGTKLLKGGEMVEVDADKGEVRILKLH